MARLKNHICAILFFVCLSAPYLLFLFFSGSRIIIRHEMEEALESSLMETLVIAVSDFHWYEEDREIIYQGQMFDVKSIRESGDSLIVQGLFDEKETLVKKQIENFDLAQQTPSRQNFLQYMALIGLPEDTGDRSLQVFPVIDEPVAAATSSLYHSFHAVLSPPPKSARI